MFRVDRRFFSEFDWTLLFLLLLVCGMALFNLLLPLVLKQSSLIRNPIYMAAILIRKQVPLKRMYCITIGQMVRSEI